MPALFDRLRRWLREDPPPLQPAVERVNMQLENAHAVLVGVGGDLANTVDDAQALHDILVDPERCGYLPANVRLLTGSAATAPAIVAALDAVAQVANEQSSVIVYFSGHGLRSGLEDNAKYFLLASGYDLTRLAETAIGGGQFARRIAAIRSKKLLILLDCCHAGGLELQIGKTPLAKAPLPAAPEVLMAGSGRVLIASSTASEVSFAGKPYSLFTAALLQSLSGVGTARQDGYVRAADLALHTRSTVEAASRKRQHPTMWFDQADNFVVAYYAGGGLTPKAAPEGATASIELEAPTETRDGGNATFNQNKWIVTGKVINTGVYNAAAGPGSRTSSDEQSDA